jgi:hypothetical protein
VGPSFRHLLSCFHFSAVLTFLSTAICLYYCRFCVTEIISTHHLFFVDPPFVQLVGLLVGLNIQRYLLCSLARSINQSINQSSTFPIHSYIHCSTTSSHTHTHSISRMSNVPAPPSIQLSILVDGERILPLPPIAPSVDVATIKLIIHTEVSHTYIHTYTYILLTGIHADRG